MEGCIKNQFIKKGFLFIWCDWLIESIKVWCIEAPLHIFCLNWLHDNISSESIIIIKHFLMCISIISSAFITTSCHTLPYIVTDLHLHFSIYLLSIIFLFSLTFPYFLQGLGAAVEAGHEMSTVPLLRITQCAFTRLMIFAGLIKIQIISSGPIRLLFKQNCAERAQLGCTASDCG